MSQSLINLNALRAISRNNESFVREVLDVFQANTPKDLDQLAGHIGEGRGEQVRYFAHKLKSSCFTIGFEKGYEFFKGIETAAEKQEQDRWQPLLESAQEVCAQALSEIRALLNQPQM
ncbi:MAG: Hpt domain-containing protein [Flavobacteriales bacterium]